jgi:hypothetical protein
MVDAIIRMESGGIMMLSLCGVVTAVITMWAAVMALREVKKTRKAQTPPAELAAAAAAQAAAKEERDLMRAIVKEARFLAKEMPVHMAIQNQFSWNFQEVRKDGRGKRRKKSLIQFDAILLTKTEIWFKVNGRKLPYGTSFSDIRKPENNVAENLQYAIHRPIQFYEDAEFNFFIRVGLKNSIMGIPRRVEWATAVQALPAGNPFAVAVGVNDNNKVIYQDLRKWPHGIIAGATGQGKSTQILQWLITLVAKNPPHMLKFIFVDLKEGVELGRFRDLPHTLRFVEEPAEAQAALEWADNEYTRRMERFKGVCQNINGWNSTQLDKLPYIFFIIDELADLMLDKKLKGPAVETMTKVARKGRAAGIHLIVATQIVEAQVLPLQIRGNFPGRCVFSVPGYSESMTVLNTGLAANLSHQGRCVYRHQATNMILQAPIATDDEIDKVIAVASGDDKPPKESFSEIELFKVALYNYEGYARAVELWEECKDYMSKNKIAAILKAYEFDFDDPAGSVIEIDGGRYILSHTKRTKAGTRPRKLVAINGRYPDNVNELHQWVDAETRSPEPELTDDIQPTEEEEDITACLDF